MGNPERFQPGDNVKVEGCDKNPTFCEVASVITKRQKRGDKRIPLKNPGCGCIRVPEEVEKIPSELP